MFCESEFAIEKQNPENLREAWDSMLSENLLETFTCEKNFEDFLKKCLDIKIVYLIRYQNRIAGLFMLTHFEGPRCARLHFVTFRAARFVLIYGLSLAFDFIFTYYDTLICWTPTTNKLACKFTKSLGAKIIGIIPNAVSTAHGVKDVQIAYLTRENFNYGNAKRKFK